MRRPALCLVKQGRDEAIPGRSVREHNMPGLDVGVRRRTLGQGEGLIHQLPRHRLGQKHPGRMTIFDRLIEVQRVPCDYHGGSFLSTSHRPHAAVACSVWADPRRAVESSVVSRAERA